MKKGTVAVGYLDNGHWSACFGLSYRDTLLYDMVTNQRIVREGGMELRSVAGAGSLAGGRNSVAKDFLKQTDAEWLFFIDTDMGFARETVDQLVESAHKKYRPVLGGLCFSLKRDMKPPRPPGYAERFVIRPTLYEYLEIEDEVGFTPVNDYKRDAVQQVSATGAACVLIHRTVLEGVREKYGPNSWFTQITHPTGDKGLPRTFSEDLSFCIRVASIGQKIHVDTAVKTTHEKGGVFLDEATYDFYRERERSDD